MHIQKSFKIGIWLMVAIVLILFIINIRNSLHPGNLSNSSQLQQQITNPIGDKSSLEYKIPELPNKEAYTIIIAGDSMVDVLGEDFTDLRHELKNYYPNKTFGIFNYGFGSTNINSLMDRLTTETENKNKKYIPILSRQFDVLIIESFGHNPLSNDLDQGLRQQEKILDQVVQRITSGHPNSVIIFLATIGANKNNYAKSIPEFRNLDSNELAYIRNKFIKNHIEYAEEHNIPLINVYEKSLNRAGTTSEEFINKDSWVHPSQSGIKLISEMIADYIFTKQIIPN